MGADINSFQGREPKPDILSQPLTENHEDSHSPSFSTSTLVDMQRLNQSGDLTQGVIPSALVGKNEVCFCSAAAKDSTETREQRLDQKVKDCFGADVFSHLKDWDWLIENRKKLEDGFKKANGPDAWDMAKRMKELSTVDGEPLIYLSKVDGPTRGDLIPKRYDIMLRRGRFRSDDYVGQVYH